MVNRKFSVVLLFLCLFSMISAQEIGVKAKVDSSNYQVGDYINYSITIVHDKSVVVSAPALKDSLKGVDLIAADTAKNEITGEKVTTEYRYTLAKYDSGDVRIPQILVSYNYKGETRSATANAVNFTVHTLKVSKDAEIKDIKEPLKIPLDWRLIALWVILGILLVTLGVYGYLYYKKRKALKAGLIIPKKKEPHEEALEALNILEAKKMWQKGQIKEYHSEITEIIRRYFEGRFLIPALEITTGELMESLEKVQPAALILETTRGFLNNADLVKFARFVPMNNINEEMMKQAFEIVNMTVSQPAAEIKGNGSNDNV